MNPSEATTDANEVNGTPGEPRALLRYGAHDDERTKPSVMLLDWIGDDEVTVRWETVRREHSAAAFAATMQPFESAPFDDDDEFAPRRFRGIGNRAGGVILGVVLGAALTIGVCAVFAPEIPNNGGEVQLPQAPDRPRTGSAPRPATTPVSETAPGVLATAPR